jgi:hypothetical protein
MGGIFGGGRPPPAPGPSATELRLEAEATKRKEDEEKRKKEELAQSARNKRGRRSLLSDEDEGRGFVGP